MTANNVSFLSQSGSRRSLILDLLNRSRLFVKGLPGSLTSKELHQHFQQSGFTPTDAKVMHRPDGSSKGFGFVGLQNEAETTKAKNELHQTFIHGSRLQVSFAKEARRLHSKYLHIKY